MEYAALGFLVGIFLGSLTYCLALRSLTKESFWGRSYCDHCKKQLRWYDLFPVLSFISSGAKCRHCKCKLSFNYLFIEIGVGILIGLLFYLEFPRDFAVMSTEVVTFLFAKLLFKVFIIGVLVAIVITDLKKGLIPDRITYPAIMIAFLFLLFSSVFQTALLYESLTNSVLGKYLLPPYSDYFYRHTLISFEPFISGIIASLLLGGFFLAIIFATKGRGMGGGDFKLGIFMGLIFGVMNAVLAILLSFFTGAIAGVFLLIFGKKKFGQTIPFGPFLALGSLIALFWGNQIIEWYLRFKV